MTAWIETKYLDDLRGRLPDYNVHGLMFNVREMHKLYTSEAHHMIVQNVEAIKACGEDWRKVKALFKDADPEASRGKEVEPLLAGKTDLEVRLERIDMLRRLIASGPAEPKPPVAMDPPFRWIFFVVSKTPTGEYDWSTGVSVGTIESKNRLPAENLRVRGKRLVAKKYGDAKMTEVLSSLYLVVAVKDPTYREGDPYSESILLSRP